MFTYATVSETERFILQGAWRASWFDQYGWEYPWIHTQVLRHARPGDELLDVGAGTCLVSEKLKADLPDVAMHVLDTKESFDRLCGEPKPDLVYHHGLAGGPSDLPDTSFDLVFSVSVLEHAYEAGRDEAFMNALIDLKRVLKPGGLMIHAMDLNLDPEIYRIWKGFSLEDHLRALDMEPVPLHRRRCPTREEMLLDPDLFVVSPQTTHELKWCGAQVGVPYFRLTGVGFLLRKRGK